MPIESALLIISVAVIAGIAGNDFENKRPIRGVMILACVAGIFYGLQ